MIVQVTEPSTVTSMATAFVGNAIQGPSVINAKSISKAYAAIAAMTSLMVFLPVNHVMLDT